MSNQSFRVLRPVFSSVAATTVSKLAILLDVEEFELYQDESNQQVLFTAFAFRSKEVLSFHGMGKSTICKNKWSASCIKCVLQHNT